MEENKQPFTIGDTVVCISKDGPDGFAESLTVGKRYTVRDLEYEGNGLDTWYVFLDSDTANHEYPSSNFQKIKS